MHITTQHCVTDNTKLITLNLLHMLPHFRHIRCWFNIVSFSAFIAGSIYLQLGSYFGCLKTIGRLPYN